MSTNSSTSFLRRLARIGRVMPRRSWKSSKRRTRKKQSRRINSVQRSPMTETVRAIEQFSSLSSFQRIQSSSNACLVPCIAIYSVAGSIFKPIWYRGARLAQGGTRAVFTPRVASNRRAEKRQRIPPSPAPLRARDRMRATRYSTLRHLTFHCFDLLRGTVGVVVRAEKMQGDVRFVADHPAVVSGCDVEDVPRTQLCDGTVVHCRCRAPRDDDTDMLDRAARRPVATQTCNRHDSPTP